MLNILYAVLTWHRPTQSPSVPSDVFVNSVAFIIAVAFVIAARVECPVLLLEKMPTDV